MSQDNVIFLYIFAAFIFFVTQRGELPKYMGYLFGTPSTSGSSGLSNVLASTVTTLPSGSAISGAVGPTSVGGSSGPTPLVS